MKKLILDTSGKSPGKKHKTDKEREEKIKFFTALLERKEVDIGEFLEAMANKAILPSAGAAHIFKFAHVFRILQNNFFFSKLAFLKRSQTALTGYNLRSKTIRKRKERLR